jgi:hypothetical protein
MKVYGTPLSAVNRYSPGEVADANATVVTGDLDPDLIPTTNVERSKLTIRMTLMRYT